MQFLLETTSVPGAPFGAGNALAFLVNNRSMIVKVPAPGAIPPLLELNSNCEGANIFLWTGMLLTTVAIWLAAVPAYYCSPNQRMAYNWIWGHSLFAV